MTASRGKRRNILVVLVFPGYFTRSHFLRWLRCPRPVLKPVHFNGAQNNYDGAGRNANGNNSLYMSVWIVF